MADTKFSALTAIVNPAGNDIIPIVDDVTGTPVSRKITVGDLLNGGYTTTATAAGTTTLTDASTGIQFFTGTSTQIVILPAANTLSVGRTFFIHNNSTGIVTLQTNGAAQLALLDNDVNIKVTVTDTSTSTGVWDIELSNEVLKNSNTGANSNSHSTDTYLTGSYIKFPFAPKAKTVYKLVFDVAKTNAGTATPIIRVRVGTAGSTSDTATNTFTFGAGTTAADTGVFEVIAAFRTVGSGTSAVIQGITRLTSNLTTTGISNAVKARVSTSSGFNSTTANLGIGVSYNGGTNANHTITLVQAELVM
jgi:hypothetical protein